MLPQILCVPILIQPCITLNIIPRNILVKRLTALAVSIVALLPDTRCVIKIDDTVFSLRQKGWLLREYIAEPRSWLRNRK